MKKFGLLVLAVMAASCLCTSSAQAEVRNLDTVPSCIDSIEPEIACFGAAALVYPADTDPNYACKMAINNSLLSCATQEMAGMNQCARIHDPVNQGNCLALNEVNSELCYFTATSICDRNYP